MEKIKNLLLLVLFFVQSLAYTGPLYDAADKGDLSAVKTLLDSGADVNDRGIAGKTALITAADKGHLAVVKELLTRGANANLYNNWGETALKAVAGSYITRPEGAAILKELLKHGALVDFSYLVGDTALMDAASFGNVSMVQRLMEAGASINAKYKGGPTPIKLAYNTSKKLARDKSYLVTIAAIRKWAIENRIPILDPIDIQILDGDTKGSFQRDFAAYVSAEKQEEQIGPDLSELDKPMGPSNQ
jgi:ankyrin repeat protein